MPEADQYGILVAVRNVELQTYWARYNIQVVLNGGLIAAVLTSSPGPRLASLPTWLVSLGGVLLATAWFAMVLQGKASLHRWDKQLSLFEQRRSAAQLYPLFTNIIQSGEAQDPSKNNTLPAAAIPVLCASFWIVLWARSFYGS